MSRFRIPRRRTSTDSVDAVPRMFHLVPLALQHVLVAYSGMVTTPLLIGAGLGLSSAQTATLVTANVLVGGIATLLQTLGVWKYGVRYPIVMASTFTAITPAILIGKHGGLPAVFGSTLVAGLLTVVIAPLFSKALRFFPPIVTGTVIAIIGFSLLPSTATLIMGSGSSRHGHGGGSELMLAGATVLLVVLLDKLAPAAIGRFAVLIALLLGTTIAVPLGLADFSAVGDSSVFGIVKPFEFGLPTFSVAAIVPMVIVQLVNMVESTGDTLAIGKIVGRPTGRREVAQALRADGAATVVAGLLNSFPMVTSGNNVGLVSITKVRSRYVVAACGLMLMLIGVFPKVGAIVSSVPGPVLGGVGIVMFGTVGAVGVRILQQADLNDGRNLLIVAIAFGFGLIPVGAPHIYDDLPGSVQTILDSGIASGAIVAFVLNLLFHEVGKIPWRPSRKGAGHESKSVASAGAVPDPD